MLSVLACDTATPGYWKNHREAWPTANVAENIVIVGSTTYHLWQPADVDALIAILGMNLGQGHGRGASGLTEYQQAWYNLAQKVIAGQLSMLDDPSINWGLQQAVYDNWRGWTPTHTTSPPYGFVSMINEANHLLSGNHGTRDEMLSLASTINWWLNELDDGLYNPI